MISAPSKLVVLWGWIVVATNKGKSVRDHGQMRAIDVVAKLLYSIDNSKAFSLGDTVVLFVLVENSTSVRHRFVLSFRVVLRDDSTNSNISGFSVYDKLLGEIWID